MKTRTSICNLFKFYQCNFTGEHYCFVRATWIFLSYCSLQGVRSDDKTGSHFLSIKITFLFLIGVAAIVPHAETYTLRFSVFYILAAFLLGTRRCFYNKVPFMATRICFANLDNFTETYVRETTALRLATRMTPFRGGFFSFSSPECHASSMQCSAAMSTSSFVLNM